MISNIKFIDDGELFNILGRAPAIALHQLRETIDDIAKEVEKESKRNVPVMEGELKKHPVEREDAIIGFVRSTRAGPRVFSASDGGSQIGGFQRILPGSIGKGNVVARAVLGLPELPQHAIWVHEGTGLYGPKHRLIRPRTAPFMVFNWVGVQWRLRTVKGQKPQPYLREAFEEISATYVPVRLAALRAEIRLLT